MFPSVIELMLKPSSTDDLHMINHNHDAIIDDIHGYFSQFGLNIARETHQNGPENLPKISCFGMKSLLLWDPISPKISLFDKISSTQVCSYK